ncbi:MAG: hypothetical protein ACODAE_03885 [Gemmatimonadota bacterium]
MILRCTFEELNALAAGAERVLAADGAGAGADETHVAAPPAAIAEIEALLTRLDGDLSVRTLADAESIERAVGCIREHLKERMDAFVLEQHVGADDAVNAYFDYAYVLRVYDRVRGVGEEMVAMIELMTGAPPTDATRQSVTFPD